MEKVMTETILPKLVLQPWSGYLWLDLHQCLPSVMGLVPHSVDAVELLTQLYRLIALQDFSVKVIWSFKIAHCCGAADGICRPFCCISHHKIQCMRPAWNINWARIFSPAVLLEHVCSSPLYWPHCRATVLCICQKECLATQPCSESKMRNQELLFGKPQVILESVAWFACYVHSESPYRYLPLVALVGSAVTIAFYILYIEVIEAITSIWITFPK